MLDSTSKDGPLGGEAVRELWCWLWAGMAERECRIWREHSSSRDIRMEKMACREVQEALEKELPLPDAHDQGDALFTRLGLGLAREQVATLSVKFENWNRQAEMGATRSELRGNYDDAMELVLRGFMPGFYSLSTIGVTPQSRTVGLDLTAGAAYEFLASLACAIETLDLAAETTQGPDEAKELAETVAALRMVLGQWVASLPEGHGGTFETIWAGLLQGMPADRTRPFAGWLGAEVDRHAAGGDTRATPLARAHRRLAEAAGLTPEALRVAAPPCAPPWEPPGPLPSAYLGGAVRPAPGFVATIVERDEGKDRMKIPLHQFLAGLVRR
jgi:hypothetical protein